MFHSKVEFGIWFQGSDLISTFGKIKNNILLHFFKIIIYFIEALLYSFNFVRASKPKIVRYIIQ